MSFLTLDVETTVKNKGSPFTKDNKLCLIGILEEGNYTGYNIEHGDKPYGSKLKEVQSKIDSATILVGFNIKFDLHWLYRYGIQFDHKKIWDCQVAHFIITRQLNKYPSLEEVAAYYKLGTKVDEIKKLWEEGYDTTEIPFDKLDRYCEQDNRLTFNIQQKQQQYFKEHPAQYRLFVLQMVDLLILREMEWNGMRFNKELSLDLAKELEERQTRIVNNYTFPVDVSFSSGDHVSALLYGGIIKEKYREHYQQTLKSGIVKDKERWSIREVELPRLVDPPPKTELKKEGYYQTDAETLGLLLKKRVPKYVKQLILDLLEWSKIDKLRGTYALGLPQQMDKHGDEEYIHGNFNQVVAVTGRLSSSNPNLQNRDKKIDHCFISRY